MSNGNEVDAVSPLRNYLELLRLPNIFTAMADVAMGFLFVQQSGQPGQDDFPGQFQPADAWVLGLLVMASSMLYAAGVVLNDVFDMELDRQQRPERPLPSGRISLRAARWLGWELLLLGIILPCGVAVVLRQPRTAVVVTLLALAIVLYNAVLKRTVLGPLAMGGCRMLNVLLGMSVLLGTWQAEHWLVSAAVGVYIVGVTWLARSEDQQSDARQLAAATAVMMAGVALLAWLPRWSENLVPLLVIEPQRWYILMALLGGMIAWRCLWAIAEPAPGRVQTAVAHAIMSLVILDAAACYAVRGTYWAIVILLLLLPATFLGRWIQST
ncbi:MAG: UbiA family prenyltransferase [Thermoguttaceae bacterium]|jgi:4-hydroxybenzoate polyprenyltransferase